MDNLFEKLLPALVNAPWVAALFIFFQFYKVWCDNQNKRRELTTSERAQTLTYDQSNTEFVITNLRTDIARLTEVNKICEGEVTLAEKNEAEWRKNYFESQKALAERDGELSAAHFEANVLKQRLQNYAWIEGLPSDMLKKLYEQRVAEEGKAGPVEE